MKVHQSSFYFVFLFSRGFIPFKYNLLSVYFQDHLQYAPWGIDPPLEKQEAELMVISEVKAPDFLTDLEDNPFCSGKILNLASLKPKCHCKM